MKSFNSFKSLSEQFYLSELLKNSDNYLAHTHKSKESEKLEEHLRLVLDYFLIITEKNKIESVIDNLIFELMKEFENKITVGKFVKILFLNTIIYHDFGKVNENFQLERMQNALFQKFDNGIDTTHSLLGAYIYIAHHFDQINKLNLKSDEECFLYGITLLLSYTILKHHSSHLNQPLEEIVFNENIVCKIQRYIDSYNFQIDSFFKKDVFKKINTILDRFKKINFQNDFYLYSFLKLNFSLLTAADYYATMHYMNSFENIYNDFGIIDDNLKNKILVNIKELKSYNKILFDNYKFYKNYAFETLQHKSNGNLNILRQKMSVDVIENIKNNLNGNLFYIEAPTGGGKTNLSMLAVSTLLESKIDFTKIFYVFPFTTLITQTYKSLIETLGLSQSEIVEVHSKSGYNIKNKEEEDKDGIYGNEKKNYIDHLFINYPISLISHIKFFNILKSNVKETNYLLHRIANSIVIIDELQSYTPKEWDKIIYFIDNYAKYFNIKFILMSATLPKLDNLTSKISNDKFVSLIPDSKIKYFLNPNFKDRVKFDFSLFEIDNMTLATLGQFIFEKSENYAKKFGHAKVVVEFIFKKTAGEFHKMIKGNKHFNEYTTLLLSGTILEPRRKEIINFLKSKNNNEKKILLISTQVIEAGVDVDMDLGFKNKSIIDSEEQLAGRINRNVLKPSSELFIFKYDESFRIYGNDLRYQIARDELDQNKYQEILENKNFDELYDLVKNKINVNNQTEMVVNFSDYQERIKNLNFYDIDKKFVLINDKTESIFVPLSVPTKVLGVESCFDNIFSDNELSFLESNKIINGTDTEVCGRKVWELFENIINLKSEDFTLKKINLKIIQGIMSKFIFSIFSYSSTLRELKENSNFEEKYGYIYLKDFENVYDYNDGIKDSELKYSIFI
ncbi:MAG: CRISPR-associated helicase Cas3' [Bacteroidota bacterium]|nr:CRISPR-associated helicase Cas3' [Bacteroidota bacterium]